MCTGTMASQKLSNAGTMTRRFANPESQQQKVNQIKEDFSRHNPFSFYEEFIRRLRSILQLLPFDIQAGRIENGSEAPVTRGLKNLGNSCFLNSVLQALASCEPFIGYLNRFRGTSPSMRSFSWNLSKVLKELRFGQRGSRHDIAYSPSGLLRMIVGHNRTLGGQNQQDAQELLQCIFSILTAELETVGAKSKSSLFSLANLPNNFGQLSFVIPTVPNNNEATHNPFKGWIASNLVCESCSKQRPLRHDQFVDISLPIPEKLANTAPSRMSYASLNTAASATAAAGAVAISLEDCLEEFCRGELLEEVECPHCSAEQTKRDLAQRLADLEEIQCLSSAVDMSDEIESVRVSLSALTEALSQGQTDALSLDLDKPLSIATTRNVSIESSLKASADSLSARNVANGELPVEYKENGVDSSPLDNMRENFDKSPLEGSADRLEGSIIIAEESHRIISPQSQHQQVEVLIDSYLVKKVRTSVRKRMFISRPSQLLCLHICRRVPCMLTGRMKKLSHHVAFPLQLDMSSYFRAGGQGDSDNSVHSADRGSGKEESRGKVALQNGLDRYSIGRGMMGRLDLKSGLANNNSSDLQYSLKAVIQHTGSADSGHYSAYCFVPSASAFPPPSSSSSVPSKSASSGKWVYFSDEEVRIVDEGEVRRCQAYMLFYQRSDVCNMLTTKR